MGLHTVFKQIRELSNLLFGECYNKNFIFDSVKVRRIIIIPWQLVAAWSNSVISSGFPRSSPRERTTWTAAINGTSGLRFRDLTNKNNRKLYLVKKNKYCDLRMEANSKTNHTRSPSKRWTRRLGYPHLPEISTGC
jgi:hypothetical protein